MEETIEKTKFCKFCGEKIPMDAVICTHCGRQVEEIKSNQSQNPQVVINNSNTNINGNDDTAYIIGKPKNKCVALILCLFFGIFGAHKFYEGKIGLGILYIFTLGLFGIGVIIDFISILSKPNPYYV